MPTFQFQKLIRDKILQLHFDAGHTVDYKKINGTELKTKLREKLHEEANEIPIREKCDDEIIEEIADVQQVLDDLKRQYDITDEQVRKAQQAKCNKKGGFVDGVFIESVTVPEHDEWVNYYRKSPNKYPELSLNGKYDPVLPTLSKGTYRHTKSGKDYKVLGVTYNTETYEPLVIYLPLYPSKYELFARPYDSFINTILVEGKKTSRFEKINSAEAEE